MPNQYAPMYYILQGLEKVGPLTMDQLKARGLTGETLVWTATFKDQEWRPARQVPELMPLLGPYIPPAPVGQFGERYSSPEAKEPPHSGFGIASFAMSLLLGAALLGLFIVCGAMAVQQGGELDEESPIAVVLGLGIVGCLGGHVLGLIFGFVGAGQPNRKKVFSYLGIAFNGLAVLAFGGLIVLGMTMA